MKTSTICTASGAPAAPAGEGVSFAFYSENERPRLKTILKYSGNSYHPITVNADGSFTACEL